MCIYNKKRMCFIFCLPLTSILPLLCLATFFTLCQLQAATKRQVRVGAFDYKPAIFRSASGQIEGFYVDLLTEIARQENWEIDYIFGSWADGLSRIKSGKVDLLTSVAFTKKRALYMDYSQESLLTVWGEVYINRHASADSFFDLQGKRIGIMKNDFNAQFFKKHMASFNIACTYIEYAGFADVLDAIASNQVDAGIVNSTFGAGNAQNYQVKGTGIVFNPFPIYFTVAKGKNLQLLKTLNAYLAAWKSNRDSPYYQGLNKWFRQKVKIQTVIPPIIWKILAGLGLLLSTAVLFTVVLRKQVKKATTELRHSEERYRTLTENIPGINYRCRFDDNWSMIFLSQQVEKLTGYPASDFIMNQVRSFASIIHPEDHDYVKTTIAEKVKARAPYVLEYRIICADKKIRWFYESGQPIYSPAGNINHLDGVILDITEQKKMQQELSQARKMDAIGQLAGGVAHDFNNMLSGIIGAAELLTDKIAGDPKAEHYLAMVMKAAERASSLTRQLLAFSRQGKPVSTSIDAHQAIRDAVTLLKRTISKQIKIHMDLGAENASVVGDIAQLQNVFLNLGINAGHAMPAGGNLFFSSKLIELNASYCQASVFDLQPGIYLEVAIRDTGNGIEQEILQHIFEPFFTTKEQGQGTGLGLAAVYGTIQQYRGSITVYSELGVGTVFHIMLPISDTEVKPTACTGQPVKGTGRILVIDDEEVIRVTAKALLTNLGYDVMTATTGREGTELFKQHPDIDLVLLDMIMPEMNGRECFKELRKISPSAKIILASGFSQDEDVNQLLSAGLLGFISKPYNAAELSKAVADALTS